MPKSVPPLVKGDERAMMTIPAVLLDDRPSLRTTEIVRSKLKAALDDKKKKYKKPVRRLMRKYEMHVEKMLRLDAEIARLNKVYEEERDKFLEVWATKDLSDIGGVTIVPQTTLQIAHLEALTRLPKEMRKAVRVVVLDPGKFLQLAEERGIPSDILEQCVEVKVARVNVKLPRKKKKAAPESRADASLAEPAQSEGELTAPAVASDIGS